MPLSKETTNALKHAGAWCYAFSKFALAIKISKRDKQYSDLERDFYDEKSEAYAIYHQSAVEYDMSLQSMLYNAVKATTKESKTFDRAAYDEMQKLRQENKEQYEREYREYFSR